MYHCVLRIVLSTADPLLKQILCAAQPLERFEHQLLFPGPQSGGPPERGDLVFFDSAALPSRMRSAYGPAARLILCAGREELAALPDEELQAADAVWEKPLEKRLTALRFRRLQESIKRDKDLRLTQSYLDAAIDTIPDMIWFKSREGLHLKVNQTFCRIVGKTMEDVTGKDHCYIWDVSRELFEQGEFVCKDTDDYVLRTGSRCQSEEKVKSQNGIRQFRTYKSPLFDEDGSVMGTVGIGHDVTDLKNMVTEMEILLRSMPYAVLVRNEKGEIINVNHKFEEYFSAERDAILGVSYEAWSAGAFSEKSTVNSEGYVEARVHCSDRMLEIHEEPIYDVFQNVVGGLSIYRDVTVERALEQQILHNSNTDFMTGLYNRRCFYQYIKKNRGAQPVTLLYLDLDCFKEVNDTYGHSAGDDALIQTTRLLQECFDHAFISRFGGDEFMIVLLGPCDLKELKCKTERLFVRMKESFQRSEHLRLLTASVGIAQTSDPEMDIDALIQQSDKALYSAKMQGRARCNIYSQQ